MARPRRSAGSAPLGEDYFARYGAGGPRARKTDYARSWSRFTFSIPAVLRTYRERFGTAPRTLLDIGAADGSLMREAMRRGLKAHGIENSPYILKRIVDAKLRRRIHRADAAEFIRDVKPGRFDVIVECAAQYLPPRRLNRYLRNLARASSPATMICLLVDPRNYGGDRAPAHAGVRTYETMTWWRKALREHGFARCVQGFYFFKE